MLPFHVGLKSRRGPLQGGGGCLTGAIGAARIGNVILDRTPLR